MDTLDTSGVHSLSGANRITTKPFDCWASAIVSSGLLLLYWSLVMVPMGLLRLASAFEWGQTRRGPCKSTQIRREASGRVCCHFCPPSGPKPPLPQTVLPSLPPSLAFPSSPKHTLLPAVSAILILAVSAIPG